MDEARRRLDIATPGRLWIVADEQDAGRGRGDRSWRSPPGNLHLTLLTPTRTALRDQPKLGFAAGVALAETASSLLPRGVDVRLKWPNDLLLDGGKASGILLEGLSGGTMVSIGIGVNIASHPTGLPYPVAHLSSFNPAIRRDLLFPVLADALAKALDAFESRGFDAIRLRWLARAASLGERISVRRGDAPLVGRFRDLDQSGRLLLETAGGTIPIEAGDVFPLDKPDAGGQELATQPSPSIA